MAPQEGRELRGSPYHMSRGCWPFGLCSAPHMNAASGGISPGPGAHSACPTHSSIQPPPACLLAASTGLTHPPSNDGCFNCEGFFIPCKHLEALYKNSSPSRRQAIRHAGIGNSFTHLGGYFNIPHRHNILSEVPVTFSLPAQPGGPHFP